MIFTSWETKPSRFKENHKIKQTLLGNLQTQETQLPMERDIGGKYYNFLTF